MSFRIKQKIVTINSRNSVHGTAEDCTINFDQSVFDTFDRMSVINGQLIKGWYLVESTVNDAISLTDSSGTYTNTINFGSFDTSAGQNGLSYWIDFALNGSGTTDTFTTTFYPRTARFIIVATSGNPFTVTVSEDVARYMGWSSTTMTSDGIGWLSSDINVYMQRYDMINVHCDIVQNANNDVLYTFLTTDSGFDSIYVENHDIIGSSVKINTNKIGPMRFQLTDELGNSIDMHGSDWQLVVTMWNSNEVISK